MHVFKKRKSLAGLSIFAFFLALLIIASFAGCEAASMIPVRNKQHTPEPDNRIAGEETAAQTTEAPPETTVEPEPELPLFHHPLTGLETTEITSVSRPVAVSFGNTSYALPQFGIGRSDVLLEFPIENGATRLVMVTTAYEDLEKIGGIRSTRDYISDVLTSFDAIQVYAGTSDVSASVLFEGRDTLDYLTQNLQSLCYRDTSRIMPHNLMTTGSLILSEIGKLGYRTTLSDGFVPPYRFPEGAASVPAGDRAASEILVTFSSTQNASFSYQAGAGVYLRSQLGEKHIDGIDREQISFTNVIVLSCDCATYESANGSEFSLTLNGGNGTYYSDGTARDVTWKMENGSFTLLDVDGNRLTVNRGTTYIGFVRVSDPNAVKVIR